MGEWKELGRSKLVKEKLLQGFKILQYSVIEVLRVERPSPPRLAVLEADDEGNLSILRLPSPLGSPFPTVTVPCPFYTPLYLDAGRDQGC